MQKEPYDRVEKLEDLKEIKIYKWKRECWKCHKETPRVTYHISAGYDYNIGDIVKLDNVLMENYPFVKKTFSNTGGEEVIANTCILGGKLQGNFFVIHEDFAFLCNEDIDKFIDIVLPNNLTIEDLGINEEEFKAYEDEYEEIHSWGHIHHIDGNRHNNELDNLILLCNKCHSSKEKKR